jgi:O-antigen/teichoic acid export membrane protein
MIPTLLSRGLGLFLLPIYTRFLNPEQYGVLDLFSIITSLINLTIALEISQALARYFQEFQDQQTQKAYVSTAFWFTVGIYLLYLIISSYFADIFTIYLLNTLSYKHIFYLASISIATNGIFLFTQNQLRWQLEPKKYMYSSLLYTFISTTVSITLLLNTSLKVESIFIGQIIGNVLAFSLSIYLGKNNYTFTFEDQKFKQMIQFSAPLTISSLAVFATLYVDRIIIKETLGLYFLGIYGMAYKFAAIAGLIISVFQSSLTPLIYKHYREAETPNNISKIFSLYASFAIFVLMGSILFSREAVMLVTTPEYYSASVLIPFLISTVFLNQVYNFAPGLGIGNKTLISGIIYIGGAAVGILLNIILINNFGIVGSAVASALNSCFIFMIYIFMAQKYYPIVYPWIKLLQWSFMTFGVSSTVLFLAYEINVVNFSIKMFALVFMALFLFKSNKKYGKLLNL